jgi:hypothetical protein
MTTLDDLMRLAGDQARRVMVGTKEELEPAWLLVSEGRAEVYQTPWNSDLEKRLVIETMRRIMKEERCTAYSLVTEAWMLRVDQPEAEYTGPSPSQSPDRQECVVVMAANGEGEHRYRTFETVRAADGTCTELRDLSKSEDRFSGVFDNLLGNQLKGRPH